MRHEGVALSLRGWPLPIGVIPTLDNVRVPRISAFYGIVIWMYYDDHNPPHFHATYGEHEALIEIDGLDVLGDHCR